MKHMGNSSVSIMICKEFKSLKVISQKRRKSKKVKVMLNNREFTANSICNLIWKKFLVQFKDIEASKMSKLEVNR